MTHILHIDASQVVRDGILAVCRTVENDKYGGSVLDLFPISIPISSRLSLKVENTGNVISPQSVVCQECTSFN